MIEVGLPMKSSAEIRAERTCGGCNMCCKLLGIHLDEVLKPAGSWCSKCEIGKGCTIYDTRPKECKTFECGWLHGITDTRPDKSKIVMGIPNDNEALIYVDQGRPHAWKTPEVGTTIAALKEIGLHRVTIVCGKRRRQFIFKEVKNAT